MSEHNILTHLNCITSRIFNKSVIQMTSLLCLVFSLTFILPLASVLFSLITITIHLFFMF